MSLSPATQISTDAKQFQEKNDYVFAGTEVKFTCSYTNPKDLAAPDVTWTATATKANVGTINDYTTDKTSAGSFDVSGCFCCCKDYRIEGYTKFSRIRCF